MSFLRRLIRGPEPEDFVPTDWVRKAGFHGVGTVQSVSGDHALVDWLNGTKEIVPFALLRRAHPGGDRLDSRHT